MRVTCALLLLGLLAPTPASAGEWEEVTDEDGIKVWQREVEGTSLVEFRGRTVIDVGIKQILAVMADSKRKTEWMQNCVENRILRAWSPEKRVVYNRTGSPWPLVDDRDVVVKSNLRFWPNKRRILIEAVSTEDDLQPPVDGVVRMPKLKLSWDLIVLSKDKTKVTYQVQADPGGMIPNWVVNMASKNLPLKTLANLRKQVTKDYDTTLAIVEASFDWSSVGL